MKNNPKLLILFALPLLILASCDNGGETSTQSQASTSESSSISSSQSETTSSSQTTQSSSETSTSESAGTSSQSSGTSSESSSASDSSAPQKTNMEKALDVIANFNIENTNGFDYSLSQYLGTTIVNSDATVLRADFSGSPIGQKDITTKRLNEYGTGEQFTTTTETNYFANNMIAEYKNGRWVWSNCRKADYFKVSIADIAFDQTALTSIRESLTTNYVLMADVPDAQVASFLGVSETTINSLSITVTIDLSFTKLEEIKLSYFQTNTRSEMIFDVYYGEVSINLPN